MNFPLKVTIAAACMATILAGCSSTTLTPEGYQKKVAALRANPALRAKEIANCIARKRSPESIESMALLLDVDKTRAYSVACPRLINGVASGAMSYDDFSNDRWTVGYVKVMQGR